MKTKSIKKMTGMMAGLVLATSLLGGCGQSADSNAENREQQSTVENSTSANAGSEEANQSVNASSGQAVQDSQEVVADGLEVTFGDNGDSFLMHLYDNDTASAIAGYVGSSDWRLPVYERDDLDYSVLEYYDIPSRYDIPSDPATVTSEKAGEVYYSDPNRIVLFYKDAEIEGDYTLIGYFDVTDEFTKAVEENPVLEGWGNKIVQIAQP